jgi:hypothetical protein
MTLHFTSDTTANGETREPGFFQYGCLVGPIMLAYPRAREPKCDQIYAKFSL